MISEWILYILLTIVGGFFVYLVPNYRNNYIVFGSLVVVVILMVLIISGFVYNSIYKEKLFVLKSPKINISISPHHVIAMTYTYNYPLAEYNFCISHENAKSSDAIDVNIRFNMPYIVKDCSFRTELDAEVKGIQVLAVMGLDKNNNPITMQRMGADSHLSNNASLNIEKILVGNEKRNSSIVNFSSERIPSNATIHGSIIVDISAQDDSASNVSDGAYFGNFSYNFADKKSEKISLSGKILQIRDINERKARLERETARELFSLGEYEKAAERITIAMELDSGYLLNNLIDRATNYYMAKNFTASLNDINQVLASDPSIPKTYFGRAYYLRSFIKGKTGCSKEEIEKDLFKACQSGHKHACDLLKPKKNNSNIIHKDLETTQKN